jgi:hypothetical protein
MWITKAFITALIIPALLIAGCHRKAATAASTPAVMSGDINSPMYWLARAEAEAPACPTTAQSGVEEWCAQNYADLGDEPHFRAAAAKALEFSKALHDPHVDVSNRWVFAPAYAEIGDRASFDLAVKAAFEPQASGDHTVVHKLIEVGLYDDAGTVIAMQTNHDTRAWNECDMAVAMAKAGRTAEYEKTIARGDFAAAIITMNRIPDRALRETNGTNVGQSAARAGRPLDPARDWIDSFASPLDRADADIQIARALIRRSKGWTNDLDE